MKKVQIIHFKNLDKANKFLSKIPPADILNVIIDDDIFVICKIKVSANIPSADNIKAPSTAIHKHGYKAYQQENFKLTCLQCGCTPGIQVFCSTICKEYYEAHLDLMLSEYVNERCCCDGAITTNAVYL